MDEPSPQDIPPSRLGYHVRAVARWLGRWALRVVGYWALGLGAMLTAFPIGLTMAVYGLLDYSADISVIRHRSVLPFTPLEYDLLWPPFAIQMALLTTLVVWLALTRPWRKESKPDDGADETPRRAVPPLLIAPILGWASTMAWSFDLSIPSLAFIAFAYSFLGLPLITLATLVWVRRRERAGAALLRWGVTLSLLGATQLLNSRDTPHVGATLAERNAWASEHMGIYYDTVSSDLLDAPILQSIMAGPSRVGPTTPQHGWLQLTVEDRVELRGWMSVDDGTRAAKCFVDYVFTREGETFIRNDVDCKRNGLELTFSPGDPTSYSISSSMSEDETRARGVEAVLAHHPDHMDQLKEPLRRLDHSLEHEPIDLRMGYAFISTEQKYVLLHFRGGGEHERGYIRCAGWAYYDHDGNRLTGDALTDAVDEPETSTCERAPDPTQGEQTPPADPPPPPAR